MTTTLRCTFYQDIPSASRVFEIEAPLGGTVRQLEELVLRWRTQFCLLDIALYVPLTDIPITPSTAYRESTRTLPNPVTVGQTAFQKLEPSAKIQDYKLLAVPNAKCLRIVASILSGKYTRTSMQATQSKVLLDEPDRPTKRQRVEFGQNTEQGDVNTFTQLWEMLWAKSPQKNPFIKKEVVFRDDEQTEIPDETPIGSDKTLRQMIDEVPTHCWTLEVPQSVAWASSVPAKVLIRNDYMEALIEVFKCVNMDSSHIPRDLNSLDVFQNPFSHCSPLYQDETSVSLASKGAESPTSFVMTGSPGIGKSIWLFFVLILRLHAKLPTIYQVDASRLWFFSHSGVISMSSAAAGSIYQFVEYVGEDPSHIWIDPFYVWGLVDSNQQLRSVSSQLSSDSLFTIQTPSPRSERMEWLKKLSTGYHIFILKLWTVAELICGRQLCRKQPSESSLIEFYRLYGASARDAYAYAIQIQAYDKSLMRAMRSLKKSTIDDIVNDASALQFHDISHYILSLSPGATRDEPSINFTSTHVKDQLIDVLQSKITNAAALLYSVFLQNPYTRTAAGWILDEAIHDIFRAGGCWPLLSLKKSVGSSNVHWKTPPTPISANYVLRISAEAFSIGPDPRTPTSCLPDELRHKFHSGVSPLKHGYYQPAYKTQVSFDSFIYMSDTKHAIVFQATVASSHDVKDKGITKLRKLGVEEITYIVVTPPETTADLFIPKDVDGLVKTKYQLQLGSVKKPAGGSSMSS
ncbi:hypothetical protein AX16_005133 [Volvariella volvacea WC 439]|nr:hypothetical protein AX16_005133 [Volvariella volvacea WC 439]